MTSNTASRSTAHRFTPEAKVGLLAALTTILAFIFAWILGVQNPFKQTVEFYITYNFAGGIEVGSPVRISGIKVGKVESIGFFLPSEPDSVALKEPGSASDTSETKAVVPLKLKVSIRKDAMRGVRADSRAYINLAGIIGERYIEITPGSAKKPPLEKDSVLAGIDPPRIDQLISQSFDLAGRIKEIIDENKGDIGRSIELLYKLSGNLNKTLEWVEQSKVLKSDISTLVTNVSDLSLEMKKLAAKANSSEVEKTAKLVNELLWRLDPVNGETIKTFFQKEGVKVRMF